MKTNLINFSDLQFIRIFDPCHIPKELIEQVRDRKYSVEKFYEYQSIVCVSKTEHGMIVNPLNLLFVIVNEKKKVVGFLWCSVAPLSQDLIVNSFSMQKDYWGKGEAVDLVTKKCKELMKESGLSRVFWITNYPKHSERYGFKRAKGVLMEYNLGEEDGRYISRDRCKTDGTSSVTQSSAKQFFRIDAESDTSASEQCVNAVASGI